MSKKCLRVMVFSMPLVACYLYHWALFLIGKNLLLLILILQQIAIVAFNLHTNDIYNLNKIKKFIILF